MSSLTARAGALSSIFFIAAALLMAYDFQLAGMNEYMGYRIIPLELPYAISSVTAIFIIGMLMPTAIHKPSDFCIFLHGLFVLLPYATLFPIRNSVELQDFVFFFTALSVPLLVIRTVSAAVPPLKLPEFIAQKVLVILLVLLCIAGVFLALLTPPASAGFDLATSYDRRFEGRDIYPSGTPQAYLNVAIINGFAPFLAFVAGLQRRAWLLVFALLCWLAFFYLIGLKAPLLFIFVAAVIGYSVSLGKVHAVVRTIYILMFGAFVLFIIEYLFFGYSLVGDYFILRVFAVPAWVSSAYLELMASGTVIVWLPLQGMSSMEQITFLVGEFLGYPGMNANTNAFTHQLAAGGIPMYILTILLVTFVFALLDATYKCKRNPLLVYLGFSYAILLTEQAATIALVSSGIGMLVMLSVFSGQGNKANASSREARQNAEC